MSKTAEDTLAQKDRSGEVISGGLRVTARLLFPGDARSALDSLAGSSAS